MSAIQTCPDYPVAITGYRHGNPPRPVLTADRKTPSPPKGGGVSGRVTVNPCGFVGRTFRPVGRDLPVKVCRSGYLQMFHAWRDGGERIHVPHR